MEPQFLVHVYCKLQRFLVTDFILYMCKPCVLYQCEEDKATWLCESVIVAIISLWKLKFPAYLLNVTKRFVMRIISYAKVVYFIFI